MIVRELTAKDIPQVIHLGGRMHEESQYSVLEFAPEAVAAVCYQIIDNEDMLGLVAIEGQTVVGMFSARVSTYLYGGELIANDDLLYVSPEYRGSRAFYLLIKEYDNWAWLKGAKMTFLSQTSGVGVETVNNLYARLGFSQVGGIFARVNNE